MFQATIIHEKILTLNIFSIIPISAIAMHYNNTTISFIGPRSDNYYEHSYNNDTIFITNKLIYLIEEIHMDNNQSKIDKTLQSFIENSSDNEKIPIIISLNNNFNKDDVLEKLKDIPTLDIKSTIEGDPIMEGPIPIIFASINVLHIKLLKDIPDINLIEYDGKIQTSDQNK
jgi:hypothetical protein